jgi:LPPG:FO 2-phospho-L-lactate transferase
MASGKIIALSGGIGGAKLCLGLHQIYAPEELYFITNTGDDFLYLGFYIAPDVDTLVYTLAGINNTETGWGRADETWKTHNVLGELGADNWFKLGDKDLALHLHRSKALRNGERLTSITQDIANRFHLKATVLPMSDHMIQTVVDTNKGLLSFQEYFVKQASKPKIKNISFKSKNPEPSAEVTEILMDPGLKGIVICPSNPYLSIDPILSIEKIRQSITESKRPRVAVSPIINGQSVKGPTTKIMDELGLEANVLTIAQHYKDYIDGIVIDTSDQDYVGQIESMGIQVKLSEIMMNNDDDKKRVAEDVIHFIDHIS